MGNQRLYFIDLVRAFAILMMLQGHFVDTLLAVEYRDDSNAGYQLWKYFRGITAPTFFTISGIIFTYLLMRSKKKGAASKRIKKGLYRGLLLIGIGYALRAPIFEWLEGTFRTYVLVVDVLQCIGLSLIITVGLYFITFKKSLIFSLLMLLLATGIFITEPWYRELTAPHLPLFIENYISKSNGSVFTIIPWVGYLLMGGFIASIFYRYHSKAHFKPVIISGFMIVGMILIYHSSEILLRLSRLTNILVLEQSANYNYLFTRLGNVLILLALFYALERYLKAPLLLKIGQKTLSIYIVHFIIIYGSLTGWGLNRIIGKTLEPWQAILGAVLFIAAVCCISLYGVKTNAFIYQRIRRIVSPIKNKNISD